MQETGRRNVGFKTGCQMLGLHREQDDKIKPGLLVNKRKLIFGATTIAAFIFIICLTIVSISSQKSKSIPVLQATNYLNIEEKSDISIITSEDNSTAESSTEALKYLVQSHPRRSKAVDIPTWHRQPPLYSNSYAQLETYRNSKKLHSISDILRYLHGDRRMPIQLAGVWVRAPMSTDNTKPPYHWDNLQKYKPGHPSEINMLATQTQSHLGPRFSNRPPIGQFKPLPNYPSHTQAIFHPFSLDEDKDDVKTNHRMKAIGSGIEDEEQDRHKQGLPVKPFSVLLDIYPVTHTTPKPKDAIRDGSKIVKGTRVVPLQISVPPFPQIKIRPGKPSSVISSPSPKPTPHRMLLHLNLYPKKRNKNGRPQKVSSDVRTNNHPTLTSGKMPSDILYDLYDEADETNGFTPQAYLDPPRGLNQGNGTMMKRIKKWCQNYENDLHKGKKIFFDLILHSFCRNFHTDGDKKRSSTSGKEIQHATFGKYAKLTSERGGITSANDLIGDEAGGNVSLNSTPEVWQESLESRNGTDINQLFNITKPDQNNNRENLSDKTLKNSTTFYSPLVSTNSDNSTPLL